MAFDDGVKVGTVAYIGLVSVLVTAATVMLLQVLYYQQNNSMQAADLAGEGPPFELTELVAKQQTALTKLSFDENTGVASVGIKLAKELVISELAARKSPDEVVGPMPAPAGASESVLGEDPDNAAAGEGASDSPGVDRE